MKPRQAPPCRAVARCGPVPAAARDGSPRHAPVAADKHGPQRRRNRYSRRGALPARAVVARIQGFEQVGEATSGEEAVDLVEVLAPNVILMDINMGEMDGLTATKLITTAHPDSFVILVSTYTEADMPPAARTCGAAAYVNKDELSPRVVRRLWESGGDPEWRTAVS